MRVKEMVLTAMMVALICVGAVLSLPIGPVAISLQSFFVMLAGLLLSRKAGVLAVTLYLFLGLIGLPVFAGGIGGMAILGKPSVGFLIGFFPLVSCANLAQGRDTKFKLLWLLLGNLSLYILGFWYLYGYFHLFLDKPQSLISILQMGVIPYLPGDALKIILVLLLEKNLALQKRLAP